MLSLRSYILYHLLAKRYSSKMKSFEWCCALYVLSYTDTCLVVPVQERCDTFHVVCMLYVVVIVTNFVRRWTTAYWMTILFVWHPIRVRPYFRAFTCLFTIESTTSDHLSQYHWWDGWCHTPSSKRSHRDVNHGRSLACIEGHQDRYGTHQFSRSVCSTVDLPLETIVVLSSIVKGKIL